MRAKHVAIGVVIGVLLSTIVVFAGNLDPPSGPTQASSQMHTLVDIYNRVDDGTTATKMTAFTEPSSGPGGTMYTLDHLYALVGERAQVARTGQTQCYDGTSEQPCPVDGFPGQDGELKRGVSWPFPRFSDNGNGTVTDNLTGLIWLQDADCDDGAMDWATALTWVDELFDGCVSCGGTNGDCNLTDDSIRGDWRLPNVPELRSLIDMSTWDPALPSDHPFIGVEPTWYWSSNTPPDGPSAAWYVSLYRGSVSFTPKTGLARAWPVRGGQ